MKIVKKKHENIMEAIKQDWKSKLEMNIENYLLKKKMWKGSMEKINKKLSMKEINKNQENIKTNIGKQRKYHYKKLFLIKR